jgi:uncharacterized membrane protein
MNWNPLPWLRGQIVRAELPKWTGDGVIQPDQEQRVGDRYAKECCGLAVADCATLTLYVLAAVAMVLAVVLITGENWRSIHFAFKICLALLLMAVSHGTGYWYRFQMSDARRGDAYFFIGTILYGVAVLLVADHARVPDLYPWAFFAWAAGTLPLAWVLGSYSMLAMANVLAIVWLVWHILVIGEAKFTSLFVAQGLCLIRWAYAKQLRGLVTLSLAGLVLWWCMLPMAEGLGRAGFFWVAGLAPVLVLIALRHDEQHPFASVYKWSGVILGMIVLLALALPSVSVDLMDGDSRPADESSAAFSEWATPLGPFRWGWYRLCAMAIAGVAVAFVPGARPLDLRREWQPLAALAGVTLVPMGFSVASVASGNAVVAAFALSLIYNAAAIAVIVGLVICGASKDRMACVAAGIAYFAVWMVLVTIDQWRDLTHAALIFAVAGAAVLAAARWRLGRKVVPDETAPAQAS